MSQEHTEQEITRLIDAWNAAELRADTVFIEKVLADNFIGIGPLGFLLSKPEWLQRHQSGEMKYSALNLSEVKVRIYDHAAIVICRQDQQASYRGNPINAQLRTTLVFVDQQGEWRLAGLHYCNIGQPPSFARS